MTSSIESIVTHFRRTSTDILYDKANVEFEVRFQDVGADTFRDILRVLAAGGVPGGLEVGAGAVSLAVNSIMGEGGPRRGGLEANFVRQILFAGKGKTDTYYRKRELASPLLVRSPYTLSYKISVSSEEPLGYKFSSNNSAVVRAKTRASFGVKNRPWRVDMTVVRQVGAGSDKRALPQVIKKMFRPGMAPADLEEFLQDEGIYKYEIELEYLAPRPADRDALAPGGVEEIVSQLLQLASPDHLKDAALQKEIFHVAQVVVGAPGLRARFEHEWGLKKLLPQVVALTRASYADVYPPAGFFLLDKADGVRALASARGGRLSLLADKLTVLRPREGAQPPAATIVDGELVEKGGALTFYAFDVVVAGGVDVSGAGYEERVGFLAAAVGDLARFAGAAFVAKPVVRLTGRTPADLKAQFRAPAFANPPYEIDGRILVKGGAPYRDTAAFKWKPPAHMTIDFLARRPPPTVLGKKPYVDEPGRRLYFLFVGINPDMYAGLGLERVEGYDKIFSERGSSGGGSYFPVQFAPSTAPLAYLYQHPVSPPPKDGTGIGGKKSDTGTDDTDTDDIDGKVVELRCTALGRVPRWELVRVREDRARELRGRGYFGNDFRVAEMTWLNYEFPFPEELLWEGTSGYFSAPKAGVYAAQTAFTSFVKSNRIEKDAAHARWVVDLAAGKGQDLGRYRRAGVRNLLAVDRDRAALAELVRRKYDMIAAGRRGQRGLGGRKRHATVLYALRADLAEPAKTTAAAIREVVGFPTTGASVVVCNLAIHYFAGTASGLRNIVSLCKEVVKVDGRVIVTTMFGQKVHDLLAQLKVGESWDYRQDETLKHSIRKNYASDALTNVGQKIGILLPFSGGEYYEEFLVNVDYLVDIFAKRGFELAEKKSFGDYVADFKAHNRNLYNQLTDGDLLFLSLYGELIFTRKK